MIHYASPTPSQEFLTSLYDYDPTIKTYPLVFKQGGRGRRKGDRPGKRTIQSQRNGYEQIQLGIKSVDYFRDSRQHWYTMSRIIWKFHYGTEPTGVIDHINGDSTDNRIENLQDITQKQNTNKKAGEVIAA